MAVTLLTVSDVRARYGGPASDAKLQSLIDDVTARARRIEPRLRLESPAPPQHVLDDVKATLRGAVVRLLLTDDGTAQSLSETMGPFSSTRTIATGGSPGANLSAGEEQAIRTVYADPSLDGGAWSLHLGVPHGVA